MRLVGAGGELLRGTLSVDLLPSTLLAQRLSAQKLNRKGTEITFFVRIRYDICREKKLKV